MSAPRFKFGCGGPQKGPSSCPKCGSKYVLTSDYYDGVMRCDGSMQDIGKGARFSCGDCGYEMSVYIDQRTPPQP